MHMTKRTVLCYGDSNTWGYNPATTERYPLQVRWPSVLQAELGDGYLVIPEGLNGRTTVWDDPIEGYKSGKEYLIPCLETHKPLDLVIIMLGTNDLKMRFSLPTSDIAKGAGALVKMVHKSDTGPGEGAPEVLLIAPPPLAMLTEFADMFSGATEKAEAFSEQYRLQAEEQGCRFMDAGQVIVSSDLDGIHLEASEQHKLGKAVARCVKEILEE
jgi:lysophospholipase L1-like esterase